jgi:hypothetical protein
MANLHQPTSSKPNISLNPETLKDSNTSAQQGVEEFNAGGVFMTHSFITASSADVITETTRCCDSDVLTAVQVSMDNTTEEIFLPIIMTDDFNKVHPVTRSTNRFDSYLGNSSKFDKDSNQIEQ